MQESKLKKLLEARQPFTSSDAQRHGVSYEALGRACRAGKIQRIRYGLYSVVSDHISEYDDLKLASKLIPYSVVCLFSALAFHELTTQVPFQIWLAIPQGRRRKKSEQLDIHYVSLSPDVFDYGIETHNADGVEIKVYSVARTVADCFKFRNKIGLDVALEALRDAIAKRRATREDIYAAAKICRVSKIILPYMESIS